MAAPSGLRSRTVISTSGRFKQGPAWHFKLSRWPIFGRGQTAHDPWHHVPVLARKPGAARAMASRSGTAVLRPAMTSKLRGSDDGDRQMVQIPSCARDNGGADAALAEVPATSGLMKHQAVKIGRETPPSGATPCRRAPECRITLAARADACWSAASRPAPVRRAAR